MCVEMIWLSGMWMCGYLRCLWVVKFFGVIVIWNDVVVVRVRVMSIIIIVMILLLVMLVLSM